jgi:hypothetical protein
MCRFVTGTAARDETDLAVGLERMKIPANDDVSPFQQRQPLIGQHYPLQHVVDDAQRVIDQFLHGDGPSRLNRSSAQ